MASQQLENERLILMDEEGNYYLIPRDILERTKVSGKEKEEVDQLVQGGETTGFVLQPGFRPGAGGATQLSAFGTRFTPVGSCACSFGCTSRPGEQVIRR